MKKLIALILMLCLLPLCALAEDARLTMNLQSAELVFAPLAEGTVLTKDSNEELFSGVGLNYENMVFYMEAYSVQAMMFDDAMETEFQVSAMRTLEKDFDDMTEAELAQLCEEVRAYYEGIGCRVDTAEVYQSPEGHKYILSVSCNVYEDGYEEYTVEYYTCQEGYAAFVMVFPYDGAPTERQMNLGRGIVDSLRITAAE